MVRGAVSRRWEANTKFLSPIRLCLRGSYLFLQRNCDLVAGSSWKSGGFLRGPQGSSAVPRRFHEGFLYSRPGDARGDSVKSGLARPGFLALL